MKYVVIAIVLLSSRFSHAQIPQSVQDELTLHLNILSEGSDGNSSVEANQIFESYVSASLEEWTSYFESYFATHNLTLELCEYLTHPTFEIPVQQVNTNLQVSLLNALADKQFQAFYANNELGIDLANNLGFRENLIYTNQFFSNYLLNHNPILPSNFNQLFDHYEDLMIENESFLRKPNYFSTVDYPFLGVIRSQIHANLSGIARLNPIYKAVTSDLIGLNDETCVEEELLFNTHGIIVSDNGLFQDEQFSRIYDLLEVIPSDLINIVNITVDEVFTNDSYSVKTISGLRLSDIDLGQSTFAEFPDDVDLFPTDQFTTQLVTELGKQIEQFGLQESNHFLNDHKDELLVLAGSESNNYLRSMEENGFYVENPELFFPHIARMFFANTHLTFETALNRAAEGNTKPMDQFLLIANLLSEDDDAMLFSTYNHLSPYFSTYLQIVKNSNGYITHLYSDDFGCPYVFVLDKNNRVTEVIPPDLSYEIPFNGVDDDCDETTLDQDADQDGFSYLDDCDDNNPNVNANSLEIPYNGIDDDCNPNTRDDDLDEDGYTLEEECNDSDPTINPSMEEIPYNGIDEDCNPETFDNDLDQDGYELADDCDDENSAIYPGAIEILDNGVDEDCDGEDSITHVENVDQQSNIEVYPNPVSSVLQIRNLPNSISNVEIYDSSGRLVLNDQLKTNSLDVSGISPGVYMFRLLVGTEWIHSEKIIVK